MASTSSSASSVLFLCNHNVIRSPMAEALLKKQLGKRAFIESAGIHAGTPDPFVATVMKEVGCDLSRHRPMALEDLEDSWFDIIIALSPEAHTEILNNDAFQADKVLYWQSADPTLSQGSRAQMLDAYRSVRDRIAALISFHFNREGAS